MGVTGRPTAGARYELERVADAGAGADRGGGSQTYRGHVHVPQASYPLEAVVELTGAVRVRVDPSAPGAAEHERACTALVRSAVKGAVSSGRALPRKIVRWRG